jgi:hypothetical protein
MYGGVHVGSKDWHEETVGSLKTGVPALPIRRGRASVLRSFEQVLTHIRRRVPGFLPGSGLHSEFAVTHSKQTMARFLPGSGIGTTHSIRCGVSSALFARSIRFAPRTPCTSLRILPRISAQIFS